MRDFHSDPRVKKLAPRHQATMVKALEDKEAADAFDDLSAELDQQRQLRRDLPKLMKDTLEAVQSAVKRPVEVKSVLTQPAKPKGTVRVPTAVECVALAASAEIVRQRDYTDPERFVAEVRSGDRNHLVRKQALAVHKSMTGSAGTGQAQYGGQLVGALIAPEFRDASPTAILPQVIDRGARAMDFKGQNAIILPKRNRGTLPGHWVSEHSTIPVLQGLFSTASLNRYKMAVLATVSEEISRVTKPEIVNVIQRAILEDTSVALDGNFIDDQRSTAGTRPAGIMFGVTPTASAGNSVDQVQADLKVLLTHLISIRARKPLLLINPIRVASLSLTTAPGNGYRPFQAELERGTLAGIPLVVAHNMPTDRVIALDADSLFIGHDHPEFDTSNQAALVMLDASDPKPKMGPDPSNGTVDGDTSVNISDAAGVDGGPAEVRSMYQSWTLALRFVLPVSWGFARTGTIAALSNVDW